jgi:hypothetical protein
MLALMSAKMKRCHIKKAREAIAGFKVMQVN